MQYLVRPFMYGFLETYKFLCVIRIVLAQIISITISSANTSSSDSLSIISSKSISISSNTSLIFANCFRFTFQIYLTMLAMFATFARWLFFPLFLFSITKLPIHSSSNWALVIHYIFHLWLLYPFAYWVTLSLKVDKTLMTCCSYHSRKFLSQCS